MNATPYYGLKEQLVNVPPNQDPHSETTPLVTVVDDDESVRTALLGLLASVELRSTGFSSALDFLNFLGSNGNEGRPNCVIIDVRMPEIGGLELQSRLMHAGRTLPIIFMSGYGDVAMTAHAMKAGARDFLPKPFRDQDMLDAVGAALRYDKKRRADERSQAELRQRYDSLTDRERVVLRLLGDGLMNKQIASRLSLSEITVKVNRGSLMKKMAAKTFAELIKMETRLKTPCQHMY